MITGWWECIVVVPTPNFTIEMWCRCAEIYFKLYPTPCTSSSQKVGAGAVIHGGHTPRRISRIWAVKAWYILCGWLYIAIGYLYKCWHIVGVFGHGSRCCIAVVLQTKINPAKLRLQSLLLQYPELFSLFHQFKWTHQSSGKSWVRSHCSTSRWPYVAAYVHTSESQGHGGSCARSHCSTSRWPFPAAL